MDGRVAAETLMGIGQRLVEGAFRSRDRFVTAIAECIAEPESDARQSTNPDQGMVLEGERRCDGEPRLAVEGMENRWLHM